MHPSSEKIGVEEAKIMIWDYAYSLDPNHPVPHSLIFDAIHVKAVIDQQYNALNQENQVLSMEQLALKKILKKIRELLRKVTHVRFYCALNAGSFTLIMVGVDYVNDMYKDRVIGDSPDVYEFARPCPPNNCGDPTSRLIDGRFNGI